MRVLIIEQTYDGGHYLNYVRYLVQAFAPLGCEIVVAVPKPAPESEQFKMYLSPHQSRFRLEFIPSRDYAIKQVEDDSDRCARLSRIDRPCQARCRVSSHH